MSKSARFGWGEKGVGESKEGSRGGRVIEGDGEKEGDGEGGLEDGIWRGAQRGRGSDKDDDEDEDRGSAGGWGAATATERGRERKEGTGTGTRTGGGAKDTIDEGSSSPLASLNANRNAWRSGDSE